ncbi:sensor histidine kinase [Halobaculum lipolyticum]|uniref:histidine kinase n=1 Tax=Halobaculum lipolyticum TaxID=3032001 RepID=A0ABD5WG62_9EURY|nr:ATP-binding protein [Halobaculum sp. DT31]
MTNDEERSPTESADERAVGDAGPEALLDPVLLDRMTDAVFALDDDWRFTYLNDAGHRVIREAATAAPDDELLGRRIWDVIPEAVDTEFYDRYVEAMETQDAVEFDAFYAPLSTWFEVRAYPSASGLSVFFRDVTAEHRQREVLETRQESLRTITETIADGDLSFEERVDALLAVGQDVLDTEYGTLSRIRDDRYVFEVVRGLDGVVETGDSIDLADTSCERVVATEGTLVLDDVERDAPDIAARAGNVEMGINCYLGVPVVVNDEVYGTFCFYDREPRTEPFADWQVTLVDLMAEWVSSALERQVVEENVRRQNDRLDEFATIVSHDLRNPLAIAIGQTELAAETCDSEHLRTAMRAHERMDQIVSDVLTMARTGTVVEDPESVDLAVVAPEAWATVDTGDATLVADDAPTVVADESRLVQLLENLFRNAVEHGGEDVTVTVSGIPGGFAVGDDGPGIPEADRDAVFDHGFTSREEGTGFGLSIVRQISEAHGWTVTVTESESGGARFEFVDADLV